MICLCFVSCAIEINASQIFRLTFDPTAQPITNKDILNKFEVHKLIGLTFFKMERLFFIRC